MVVIVYLILHCFCCGSNLFGLHGSLFSGSMLLFPFETHTFSLSLRVCVCVCAHENCTLFMCCCCTQCNYGQNYTDYNITTEIIVGYAQWKTLAHSGTWWNDNDIKGNKAIMRWGYRLMYYTIANLPIFVFCFWLVCATSKRTSSLKINKPQTNKTKQKKTTKYIHL